MAQQVQKQIGQTGIPAYNVSNACATGATALRTVMLSIKAGEADMGLAVGVEQMGKMGLLGGAARRRRPRSLRRRAAMAPSPEPTGTSARPACQACSPRRAWRTPTKRRRRLRAIRQGRDKNHLHSTLNPLAQYQKEFSLDEVMGAPVMSYPNTLLMCCPTGDGAAAAVLVSGERLKSMPKKVQKRAVKISASVLTSDPWTSSAQVQPDVNTLTRNAAAQAYEQAGLGPTISTSSNSTTASPPPS